MSEEASFERVLHDIFAVFRDADASTRVLTTAAVPQGFYESNPSKILRTLEKFVKSNASVSYTDVTTKYNSGEYNSSPYKLYHDIKVAASKEISNHKMDSDAYKEIDFFYKFTTELLMREVSRLGARLFKASKEPLSELEYLLKQEFKMISQNYLQSNGEVVTFISKPDDNKPNDGAPHPYSPYNHAQRANTAQPLFSSLLSKSELDTKHTILGQDFAISKVIPVDSNVLSRSTNTLENLSPETSKLPPSADPYAGAILHDFFHPMWFTLPAPTWLDYKVVMERPRLTNDDDSDDEENQVSINADCASFAPSVESKDFVVSAARKNQVWFQHVGIDQINKIKQQYYNNQAPSKPVVQNDDDEMEEDDEDEEPDDDDVEPDGTVDIKNLLEWDPIKIATYRSLKSESKSIDTAAKLQQQISRNLVRLNKLRYERLLSLGNSMSAPEPSPMEVILYNKTLTLIKIGIQRHQVSPSQLAHNVDKRVPILESEYSGTLPGLPDKVIKSVANGQSTYNSVRPSTRLPSIRGPYKKKVRF